MNTKKTDIVTDAEKLTADTAKTPKKAASTRTTRTKAAAPAAKKTFPASEPVMCTSVTAGELIMIGKKTKNLYRWSEYGDRTEVEYQDLQSAKLTRSQYIYQPLIMIENEDLLDTWNDVQELYNKAMHLGSDISALFNLDNAAFERTLKSLPAGFKRTLKTMAYSMAEDGTLDSLRKIRIIDEVLGTDIITMIKE